MAGKPNMIPRIPGPLKNYSFEEEGESFSSTTASGVFEDSESGPSTSAAVALSDALTSAAELVGSALGAGGLGTDLETLLALAGFALADVFLEVASASAFFRRAK